MYVLSRVTTGYAKLKRGKGCEDAVFTKQTKDCVIMACADGHGDRKCKYADKGAKFATWIICKILQDMRQDCDLKEYGKILNDGRQEIVEKLVCEWVGAILDDYMISHPEDTAFNEQYKELRKYSQKIYEVKSEVIPASEYRKLAEYRNRCENEIYKITLMYGTTLNAMVVCDKFVFAIGIGDGDVVAVNDKRVEWLLPQSPQFDNSPASLCKSFGSIVNSYAAIYVPVSRARKLKDSYFSPELLMISSDGLRNSFFSDQSFADKIYDIADCFKKGNGREFVKQSGTWIAERSEFGVTQDDVSFCMCTKYDVKSKKVSKVKK